MPFTAPPLEIHSEAEQHQERFVPRKTASTISDQGTFASRAISKQRCPRDRAGMTGGIFLLQALELSQLRSREEQKEETRLERAKPITGNRMPTGCESNFQNNTGRAWI
jgi:hypothetical protein